MKKSISISVFMLILASSMSLAQATENAPSQVPQIVTDPMNYAVLFTIAILLSTILVLMRIVRLLTQQITGEAETPKAETEVSESIKKVSVWTWLNRKLSDAVPVEREEDVMLDHDYDGIKELDNNLPPWWKYGFYITILFALVYLIQYHVIGKGSVQLNEYNAQMQEAELLKQERLKEVASNVDETTVTPLMAGNEIEAGHKIYTEKCMVCHGKAGEGTVGPNLTDEFWIHGGGIKNIFKTVKYGVPSKGMLAWQGQLTPVQIQQVSSFILTLQGTNPPNPKEPQGDKYIDQGTEESAAQAVTDSSVTEPVAENPAVN